MIQSVVGIFAVAPVHKVSPVCRIHSGMINPDVSHGFTPWWQLMTGPFCHEWCIAAYHHHAIPYVWSVCFYFGLHIEFGVAMYVVDIVNTLLIVTIPIILTQTVSPQPYVEIIVQINIGLQSCAPTVVVMDQIVYSFTQTTSHGFPAKITGSAITAGVRSRTRSIGCRHDGSWSTS